MIEPILFIGEQGLATIPPGASPVTSVNGMTGAITLTYAHVGAAALVHAHTASQITDFSEAVDDRVATLLTDSGLVTVTYDDAGNTLDVAVTAVTSVDMSVPSILSIAGNPITSTGTLAVTLATQSANLVFSGPSSGGATAPTFRVLVSDDIPSLDAAKTATGVFGHARLGTGGGGATKFLREDSTYQNVTATLVPGTTPVTGGGNNRIMYENPSNVLHQDANFLYSTAVGNMVIGTSSVSSVYRLNIQGTPTIGGIDVNASVTASTRPTVSILNAGVQTNADSPALFVQTSNVSNTTYTAYLQQDSATTGINLRMVRTSNATTTQPTVMETNARTSGTPSTDFGASHVVLLASSTMNSQDASRTITAWSDAIHGTRTSYWALDLVLSAAAFARVLTVTGAGEVRIGTTANYVGLTVSAPVSYTITLPSAAPASGTSLTYNGSAYVWSAPASGTTFLDSVFAIQDNGDPSKQIVFQASGITAATSRTITMPDRNVTLDVVTKTTTTTSGADAGGIWFSSSGTMATASGITITQPAGTPLLTITSGFLSITAVTNQTGLSVTQSGSGNSTSSFTQSGAASLINRGAISAINTNTASTAAVVYTSGSSNTVTTPNFYSLRLTSSTSSAVYDYWADGQSSGTPVAGFGVVLSYVTLESSTTAAQDAAKIIVDWSDATHATLTSQYRLQLRTSGGALADVLTVTGAGAVRIGTSSNYVGLAVSAPTSYTITLPSAAPGSNTVLTYNGSAYVWSAPVVTVVSDSTFRIQDNGDATKQIAFEASSITTATTRTITMPDRSLTLDTITTATQNGIGGQNNRFLHFSNSNLADSLPDFSYYNGRFGFKTDGAVSTIGYVSHVIASTTFNTDDNYYFANTNATGVTTTYAFMALSVVYNTTNVAGPTLRMDVSSSGTPVTGFGSAILTRLESSTTSAQDASSLITSWSDPTHSTRTSLWTVQLVSSAAALANVFAIAGNGSQTQTIASANTGTVHTGTTTIGNSTGTPTAGFGVATLVQLETSTTNSQDASKWVTSWSDATHATRTTYVSLEQVNSASALTETFRFNAGGDTKQTLATTVTSTVVLTNLWDLNTTGIPAAGFGVYWSYTMDTNGGSARNAAYFQLEWTDPADATYTSRYSIWMASAGTVAERFRFDIGGLDIRNAAGKLYINGTQVVTFRDTGWALDVGVHDKTAKTVYAGQSVSAGYVQSEAQATDDRVKTLSEQVAALKALQISHHGLAGA